MPAAHAEHAHPHFVIVGHVIGANGTVAPEGSKGCPPFDRVNDCSVTEVFFSRSPEICQRNEHQPPDLRGRHQRQFLKETEQTSPAYHAAVKAEHQPLRLELAAD